MMRPTSITSALLAALVAGPGPSASRGSDVPADLLDGLPAARVEAVPGEDEIVVELEPVDLPAGASHHSVVQPRVSVAKLPTAGSIYGFRVDVVDAEGRQVPELLHHFNFIDPQHRELFLPISRRVLAAGRETGAKRVPWFWFGSPFGRGDRLLTIALLHNPTSVSHRGVRVQLVLLYTPAGRPWPLFSVYPWQLDVAFPVGDKSYDLPPGRSERSYEASPAVPGKIVAVGGHLHDYAVTIALTDATTGETIWRTEPIMDSPGHVVGVPVAKLYGWTRLGVHIVPQHRYRVTAIYDNPTGRVIPEGGMGELGGLFIPDRGVEWPPADVSDTLYQQDLRHALRLAAESKTAGHPHSTRHEGRY